MYDVAIVGSGPAGATLARLIGNDYRVLVIDRRTLSGPVGGEGPDRCCGGLVAPAAQKVLASMRLGLPQDVLVGPQVFAVRVMDFDNNLDGHYQRHYINVDRAKFDRWLVSLVPPSVRRRDGCRVTGFEPCDGGTAVRYVSGGRTYVDRARLLVAADGGNSLIRRSAMRYWPDRMGTMPQRYIAIQEWFDLPEPPPYFSAIFDSDITDFYSWTIPKTGALLVGSALRPGRGASGRFDLLKRKLTQLGFRLGRRTRREGAFIYRPRRMAQICTGAPGVALVGEAAGWISPSSAEGYSFAFDSAVHLAEALRGGIEGCQARYAALSRGMKLKIAFKSLRCPLMYDRRLRGLIVQSGWRALSTSTGLLPAGRIGQAAVAPG